MEPTSTPARPVDRPLVAREERERRLRRRLVAVALSVTALALLHHLDHVVRGEIVVDEGRPRAWNHSGWPFQDAFTPFTASLGVYLVLVGGIVLTLLRKAWAGYWLASAILLLAIVLFVHFLGRDAETPSVLWRTYDGGLAAVLAVADLAALFVALTALSVVAIRARRESGRWRATRNDGALS